MRWLRLISSSVLSVSLALPAQAASSRNEPLERPPQFILLSFDGSKSISFWRETKAFADKYSIGFTYFMSGVYFLSGEDKKMYQGPGHRPGSSDIGFGKDHDDIKQRIGQVLGAADRGLELGSHANGHFDGSRWTLEGWTSEIAQFGKFITNAFSINKIQDPNTESLWNEKVSSQVRGFRAPLLGVNKDLYTSLKVAGYTYDTSGIGDSRKWPYMNRDGLWMFPLQSIRLAGTGKLTVTMDYNILVSQCNNQFAEGSSGGACKTNSPEMFQQYEDETYETYVQLFKQNYFGNRAPIVIGHHFSLWNKGAYWKAMQRFAADVCTLEEVRCVTYKEIIEWMQDQKAHRADILAAYQQGLFRQMAKRDLGLFGEHFATFNLEADLEMREQGQITAKIRGRDAHKLSRQDGVSFEWKVDGETKQTSVGRPGTYRASPEDLADGKVVTLSIRKKDKELLGATRTIRKNEEDEPAWLQNTGWQERLLKGDLPEAHNEVDDEDLIRTARVK